MAARWQENYQVYKRYVRNLALMYQKRQDLKAFTELLLTLSVIVIFGVFAIRPTIITIVGLNRSIGEKQDTLSKLDSKINALTQAQSVYDANLSAIQTLNESIPDRPFPVSYARQIEGLVKRHDIYLVGMNTENIPLISSSIDTEEEIPADEEAQEDGFPERAKSFNFEMTFTGDYQQITNFLRDFENMRNPMYTDTFSVQISQSDLPGQLFLVISGRLAYLE